ncbi:MAG: DUF6507 family protein [Pseudoclavibacter sp.]|nr:DUF6507 family protein [Pseudoclavibacter sp.]
MSEWRIDPQGVRGVLEQVQGYHEGLNAVFSEGRVGAVNDGFSWGSWVTASVAEAVASLLSRHEEGLADIRNSITAGKVGTVAATTAYAQGQEEMAGVFQQEMVQAAGDGDFSVFVEHGYLQPPEQGAGS